MVYGSHVRTKKEKRVWKMETDPRQKKMSSVDISDADHYFVEAALLWRLPQREESQTEPDV